MKHWVYNLAVLVIALTVGISNAAAGPPPKTTCTVDEYGNCMDDSGSYNGDYSTGGYAEDTSEYDALYGGWAPTYDDVDGYYVDGGGNGNSGDDLYYTYWDAAAQGCKSTYNHPIKIVFGSGFWVRHLEQQAKWCYANGHLTSIRTHTVAYPSGWWNKAKCFVQSGPSKNIDGGGPSHWYVDVHARATFGCDFPQPAGTVYDTINLVASYFGGPPGTPGDYGWIRWDE